MTKEPTCTEAGEKTYTCTCGEVKVEPIKALGHDLKEEIVKEPTCGTAGSKELTCSRCNYKEVTELPAIGEHAYGDWVIVTEATCTEDGVKTYTCDVCKQTKEEVIKAKGHTLEETIVKEPTCGEAGLKSVRCTVCGYEDTQVEIPATGEHKFGEWVVPFFARL